ncbi:MAG: phosphoribosylamine--glycine ligase [Pseudomonadota bacterium]
MNILVIGSGGREHALTWKLSQSSSCDVIYCAPGNAGISDCALCPDLAVDDHAAIIEFCREKIIDLVVVGPEGPLVAGLADDLRAADIATFGPSAVAAQLEGSKAFTKKLCAEKNIPTAAFARFNNAPKAKAYVRAQGAPIVIKADGLAAGKGVTVADTIQAACAAIDDCFEGEFGDAGAEVVVEDCLVGEEASMFFLCDGETALPFGTAQDHKRVGDGDVGPNTGGMGAYSPAPVMDDEMIARTISDIIEPTLEGMAERGMPFRGVLYAGLMITTKGPELIEYNVRFGDPECQVLMMRLESDLLPLLQASASGSLAGLEASWLPDPALTVVMASKGYPGSYKKGTRIKGTDHVVGDGLAVFHAGTKYNDEHHLLAVGGRVLNVTARGESVRVARDRAYGAVDRIDWEGGFCRRDIGWRAIEREDTDAGDIHAS